MERRTFLKGMAGVTGVVLLGGCARNPDERVTEGRPTVRVESWSQLGWPSPFGYAAGPGYWRTSLMFDTLLWPDSTGQLLPWLASDHASSEDGLVHTLRLREAMFHDGRPMTARNVAFTYDYFTTRLFTPLLVGLPRKGATVTATADRTVEFRLATPDATFVRRVLGTMLIVPEHIWKDVSNPMGKSDKESVIGTGPYTLASHSETEFTESFDANDAYFLGPPFVKRLEQLAPDDPLVALRVGDLDAAAAPVEGLSNDALKPFQNKERYGIVSREGAWCFPLFFNIAKGGALADVRFRRACLHAINREDMVRRLLTGNGMVGSQGFLSPTNPYYNPNVRTYPFDGAQAERLLDEAGYRRPRAGAFRTNPDGSQLRYTLHIPTVVPIALAELTAENLKAVGIDIDLQRIDLVQLFGKKLSGGGYDLLLTSYPGPSGAGADGDPDILRGTYHSDPPTLLHHATGYRNPEVDRLLDAQLVTIDNEERKRLVFKVQELVADDLPVAVLYYTTMFHIFRRKVFDQWYFTPGGFGPGIPDVYNKHPYVTGRQTGLEVRREGGAR